jgi:hypothetical protein
MEGWILFWKIAIYVGVGLFAVMSLWVIVAGYGDIRRMFVDLAAQRDSHADDDVP